MEVIKGRVYGLTCDYCGAELAPKRLSVYKKCANNFCNNKCKGHFRAGEKGPSYKTETSKPRQVMVNGKKRFVYQIKAEEYIGRPLRGGEVVYHIDGDPFNHTKKNMMVFESNGDHQRFHLGFEVEILFDGSKL